MRARPLLNQRATFSRQMDICLSRVISHKAKPGIHIPRILYFDCK